MEQPAQLRPSRVMAASDWVTLLVLSLLWGGSFFFTGVALTALPPFTLVALRVGLAALILNLVLLLAGEAMPRDRKVWLAFFGLGLLNNAIPFSLIVWGQTHIASGLAAILNATTPLFTVLVAHLLTVDERMTSNRVVGVLVGLAGVVAMVGPAAFAGLGTDLLAQCAVLGAAVSYAFAGIFGRRFRAMGVSPLVTATGQLTASTCLLLPVALAADRPWMLVTPGFRVWAAVLGLAILSSALAYLLYFRLLAKAGATNASLVTFLVPVWSILLGVTFLGERLDHRHYVGMALIGMGLAIIDGRLLRLARARPRHALMRAGGQSGSIER